MLDKLNKILIALEDAVDSEDWSLVQQVTEPACKLPGTGPCAADSDCCG